DAFLHRADELARSLLDQGITGMKIWPFDPYAEASLGHDISRADLDRSLEPFRKIRSAVGSEMDVMVELHALWDVPAACRIAAAHLSLHLPNAILQESVRAFWDGWYGELVSALPAIEGGMVSAPPGPGLGIELRPEVFERADVHVRTSEEGR